MRALSLEEQNLKFISSFADKYFMRNFVLKHIKYLTVLFPLAVAGCFGDSGSSDFAGLDSSSSAAKVPCAISTKTPEVNIVKVAASGGTLTSFNVITTTSSCKVYFFINGVKFNNSSTQVVEILSSSLTSGVNTIRVEAQNDLGSDSFEWTATKNTPPTCTRSAPSAATSNMINSAQQTYTATGSPEAGENLSFNWKLNGASSSSVLTPIIASSTASQVQFSPNSSLNGINTISAEISDGLDNATCTWTANVGEDCSVTGKNSPNQASWKVANGGTVSSSFSVNTTSASCLVNWSLNGIDMAGTTNTQSMLNTALNIGSNVLKAEVVSGGAVTSQTWTVVKNTPPTCTQSPAATGSTVSVGLPLALTANINDVNGDTVTWSWTLNGSAVANPPVTVVDGANTSILTFTPASGNVGYNSFTLFMNDGYDSATCSWTVQANPLCSVASSSPGGTTATIANLGTTLNSFSAIASDGSCALSWTLNGVNLGTNSAIINLLSSSFSASNTLVATVSNASSSATRTWTITKNTPPVCATLTPLSGGTVIGVGSSQTFTLDATDANSSQTLSYSWLLDGAVPSASYMTTTSAALQSYVVWTALSAQVGSHNLSVNINDGFDTTTCSWTPEVMRTCAVSTSTPSGSTLRVANLGTTSTSFGAVANDGSCAVVWKVNGSTVASDQNFYSAISSNLSASNTIQAVLTNSVSTITKSWTVTKNAPPVCSSQSPSASGTSMNVGASQAFNLTASDGDGDALSYVWAFNGGNTGLFSGISGAGFNAAGTLTVGLGQVGVGHLVTSTFNDTYDTAVCTWALDVVDPNSAHIVSYSPTPATTVILSNGSQLFNISASGTGLVYQWYLDNVLQAAKTTSSATFTYSDLSVGSHNIKIVITDTYGNTDQHIFAVLQNAKPVLSSYTPNTSGISAYKLNFESSMSYTVTATDGNSDTLTYNWTLDNNSHSSLVAGSPTSQATFSPAGNTLLLGPHVLMVSVTDGYESVSQSWNIQVNYFSSECNTLYNSASTSTNGGRVCTLVGSPSMGHGQDNYTDPTLIRAKPFMFIEISSGVYVMTDMVNHTVNVYNSNTSGSWVGLGQTVAAKTTKVVLGSGALGLNDDASTFYAAFQAVGSPSVSMPSFKLNNPRGVAWDSTRSVLYVADSSNHRVLALNSSGNVLRVLGLSGAATTNNSTTNSATSALGASQVCNAPVGMAVGGRYLYVACNGTNAIKKVNIDDPSSAGTYTYTTIAVGRRNSGGNPYVTAGGEAISDGLGGGDTTTPSSGSAALVNNPYAVEADGAGLIYWLERSANSHGLRLRALNPTASPVTLLATPTSDWTSTANLSLMALDLDTTGNITTIVPASVRAYSSTTNTVNALSVSSIANGANGGCHSVGVTLMNGATPIVSASSTLITMSSNGAGSWYSDTACASALGSNQVTIASGSMTTTVYFKPTANATHTLTATSAGGSGTSSLTVTAATTTPTKMVLAAVSKFKFDDCIAVELVLANGSNVPAPPTATKTFNVSSNNMGSFYSNSTCSTQIDRISFSTSQYNRFYYYKRNIVIPAGWVASIAGYDNVTQGAYTDWANLVKLGEIKLPNTGGLGIMTNAGTGLPDAFSWSTDSLHAVSLIRWGSTTTYGGRTFSQYRSDVILGLPNSLASPSSISSGYNGDDQAAWGSSVNTPYGASINIAKTQILVGDYTNLRGRAVDLDANGYVRQIIGAGRDRFRANVSGIQATDISLYNPYKLEYSNNYLYFSEYNNNWIRRVNMQTGIAEVVAGNGSTNTWVEGNDAVAEGMRQPVGFKVVPYPNSASPTNYVLFYAESFRCLVRAVNVSGPNISNFFGVGNLLPGKVKTIAGDPANGCATWSTANTDGMAATSGRLNQPEDVAFIDGDIYIIQYADHCIVKVSSTGLLTRPQGNTSCSTTAPSNNDSTMDTMRTREPRAFAPDASYPGNYFFVDSYTLATGLIRYLNSLTQAIVFKNAAPISVNARASTSSPFVVKQIYSYVTTSANSNIGGISSWAASTSVHGNEDKVCWSAGSTTAASSGAHAIYCANRFLDDTGTLAAGPSETTGIRGGSPLDREQEGIHRLNATFYSPYGLAFDTDGNLYVTDYGNHIIRMVRRWW